MNAGHKDNVRGALVQIIVILAGMQLASRSLLRPIYPVRTPRIERFRVSA